MRAAYGFTSLIGHGEDGRGRTIVVIVADQDPTLSTDLAAFDSQFGLPAPPSFKVVAPFGITPFEPGNPEQLIASSEIAIDVEWSHAIAPGANIVLALGRSGSASDLVATERYVVEHNLGDVVSMSYGETEECMPAELLETEHAIFRRGVKRGMTFVASAGDNGAAVPECPPGEGFLPHPGVFAPASDPNVTGVGGTSLQANLSSGEYESESVWNGEGGAGGGGFSALYATPRFQEGVPPIGTKRGVPDVAYDAGVSGGVIVAWGSSGEPNEFWTFGGTSIGAPQWAGLTAIADQAAGQRLGNINPELYSIAGKHYSHTFYDITEGNNSFAGITGYSAAPGWDAVSGWGSPIASFLVPELAKNAEGYGENAEP
jgi:subtilase family serine protease